MCVDDGCDELLCCLCAPLAAIFLCKICKNKPGSNDVNQAPDSALFRQSEGRIPGAGVYDQQGYGPPSHNHPKFHAGGPQPQYPPQHQAFQGNYFPPQQGYTRNDLPPVHIRQQPRPYQ